MRTLSATEAINPALECTKTILFRPFRKGASWKLAASAYLSLMGRLFIPVPLFLFMLPGAAKFNNPLLVVGLAILGVFLTGILFVIFVIGCRFQFILFDIVLTRTRQIAPLWRRNANHTWPWRPGDAGFLWSPGNRGLLDGVMAVRSCSTAGRFRGSTR